MRQVAFAAVLSILAVEAVAETDGTWAFAPGRDTFSEAALLDLSSLNEAVAGQSGFITRSQDGASFLRGDGRPIRFWAVNTSVAHKGLPALREHARFLGKRGVNMVRMHGQLPRARKTGGPISGIDRDARTRLWQLVAAMKEEGIYVTFSPYYPHAVHKEAARRWQVPQDSPGLAGLIYFDPVLQEAYKGWLRETLVPVNPHTGLALKDDPALAILQMQNEDSLLFWTFNSLRGREARLLAARFGAFLKEKYGSLDAARRAWNDVAAPGPLDDMADDWSAGLVALSNIWHLTGAEGRGRASVRLKDQAQFLAQTMYDWHAEVARFLRDEIGSTHLFNPGNWWTADDRFLDDMERYTYTAGDVIGANRYVTNLHEGERRGWAIVEDDVFREEGLLARPGALPTNLRQPVGYPYILPETLWVPPMWQQSEGPLLMAAYQALTGVDISYWFASNEVQWRAAQSANGFLPSIGKWYVGTPQLMGAFPAAALIFRLGLVDEADPVVIDHRAMEDLWSRKPPLLATRRTLDPNRADAQGALQSLLDLTQPTRGEVNPLAFLAGPVLVEFDSNAQDFVHTALEKLIDTDRRVVTSLNQQLGWDWGQRVVTVNAPRAQGVIGNLESRNTFSLRDVTIESTSRYATVMVVPLDSQPIDHSARLLLQIGSIARPSGWQSTMVQREDGPAQEVVTFGGAPWRIEKVVGNITISNAGITRARVLDANGMPTRNLTVAEKDGGLSFALPEDALYVIVD